jgi:hypothetical protein
MNSKTLTYSILLLSALALTFCKSGQKTAAWQPPADKYAFIEYYVTFDGKALAGTPPPGMRIDGPTYNVDKEGGEITSYMDANFGKDTVSIVMGAGRIRRGTEGGGLSSRLIGFSKLPHTEGKVTIKALSSNGITFSFEDETLELLSNNEWVKITESIDTIPAIEGNAVIQRKVTHQLKFHGYFEKEKLILPKE